MIWITEKFTIRFLINPDNLIFVCLGEDIIMGEMSFINQILLEEIAGKNKAIHAYDKILWTVRSGFLTIFFAGWGFFLESVVDISNREVLANITSLMLFVSAGISICGFIIDLNYVQRKFRVISALNQLYLIIVDNPDISQMMNDKTYEGAIAKVVRVSGDSGDKSYHIPGYEKEREVSFAIFFLPLISIGLGLYINKYIII